MVKLLNTYRAAPTVKNALRLRAHSVAHPMSLCILAPDQLELLATAVNQANASGEV